MTSISVGNLRADDGRDTLAHLRFFIILRIDRLVCAYITVWRDENVLKANLR